MSTLSARWLISLTGAELVGLSAAAGCSAQPRT
jgi:hypothetical protein